MPCWFYDKQELRNTPSFRDGVDPDTEARYRREGARFILDCGAKLGLRYDTYGTGAIYFHRFYMFRSFREFHRYLTACSCLFLAGKVEETPKKCKDLIKMAKTILTEQKFNKLFDDDPKEEILLVEKILLQTLKFDLMVEHPYSHLLRFGKMLKGDKAKIEKMVQMSWTFINDSLCTTLCLQWEGEVIGAALIYLATRLSKIEIHDWEGKPPGFQGKWWEHVIKEVSLDLLEDICHQVLDLYSQQMSASQKQSHQVADSPPPPPPPPPKQPTSGSAVLSSASHSSTSAGHKRSRSNTPVDVAAKKLKSQPIPTITGGSTVHANIASSGHPAAKSITPPPVHVRPNQQSDSATLPASKPTQPPIPSVGAVGVATTAIIAAPVPVETAMKDGKAYNPFVSSVSASYMSAEGGKSIQAMLAPGSHASQPAPSHISAPSGGYAGGYPTPTQPPPPGAYKHPPPGFPVTQQAGNSGNSQQYNMSQPYTAPQYGNDNMQGQNPSVPTPGTSYSGADNRAGNTVTGSGSHVGRGGSYNTAHNSRDSFQHTPHQQQYKQPPPSYSEKSSYYEKYDDERDSQYGYSQYDSGQESGGDYQRRNTGYRAPSGSGSHMGGSRDERGTGGYQQHYNPRPQSYPPGPPPPRGPYGQHPRRPRLH